MAHYVIGDVQGCYQELMKLLIKIKFKPEEDKIIFAGDLVNRGKESLEVLEFCMQNKKSVKAVLGNHDFYLLYLIEHKKKHKSLEKNSRIKKHKKISYLVKKTSFIFRNQDKRYQRNILDITCWHSLFMGYEISKKLIKRSSAWPKRRFIYLLANIWGDTPRKWDSSLTGYKRLRTIINYFTRMRFLRKDGSLVLESSKDQTEKTHIPWFKQTVNNLKEGEHIIFGHWAALEGKTKLDNIIGLDTGCVWGNKLTAIRLEDKKLFQVRKI